MATVFMMLLYLLFITAGQNSSTDLDIGTPQNKQYSLNDEENRLVSASTCSLMRNLHVCKMSPFYTTTFYIYLQSTVVTSWLDLFVYERSKQNCRTKNIVLCTGSTHCPLLVVLLSKYVLDSLLLVHYTL